MQQKRDDGDLNFLSLAGDPEPHPVNGFIAVDYVGFGMALLKRSAIELMAQAYADLDYHVGDG